jgi:hypothetical protein
MRKYLNKFTIFKLIFFIIVIVLLQIYYQYKIREKEEENTRHELTMQMIYTILLVHGEKDTLQEKLIESLQDILIWMESENKSDQDFKVICDGWNDDVFHKKFDDANNTKFEKIRIKLDKICKTKEVTN